MSIVDNILSLDQSELHQMRYIVRTGFNVVFEYDSTTDDLREWLWPVYDDGSRVPPSELRDYCLTHRLKGPRCFCARFSGAGRKGVEVEAAMFVATAGAREGKYVARCAEDACGYEVVLENLYTRRGLRVATYPKRGTDEERPATVLHVSERGPLLVKQPGKRKFYSLELDDEWNPPCLSPRKRIRMHREAERTPELQRLEAAVLPGLTTYQFRSLFRRCPCGLVTTRAAFARHFCIKQRGELSRGECDVVIDLTRSSPGRGAEEVDSETGSQASTVTDVQ